MSVTPEFLKRARPGASLFVNKEWLSSPEPFPIPEKVYQELQRLGHRLHIFQRACNEIYFRSVAGKLPSWIAAYLDAGKPPELIAAARDRRLRHVLPGVIRPDLVLTESGIVMAEIDSVPGGIGLTAWLNSTYSSSGSEIIGGANGMQDGFRALFPEGADIVVSREAGDYLPEMQWLATQLGREFSVAEAESHRPTRDIYRFFELFDHANVPHWPEMQEFAAKGRVLTAPIKPWLEEKMWLALFWSHPLRELWRRELRENHRDALAKVIPKSWIIDPSPVPHHAVLPELDICSWDELTAFTQKERHLVLKLSGFSDRAWGARSVTIGHDVSHSDWTTAVREAVASFPANPYVLQQFHRARVVRHPYFDPMTGQVKEMEGRVRLCPYYFAPHGQRVQLGGVLATIVPADKKIIHGMKDAIILPCRRE